MTKYLTVKETAALVRHEPDTVRRWIQKGKLKARKVGKAYLLLESDVREFVEGNSDTSTP